MQGATTDDEPMGRNPGTSEAANLTAPKVRGCDLAPRFADLIEASGHVPCFKAVHMNAPSTRVKSIEKLLAPAGLRSTYEVDLVRKTTRLCDQGSEPRMPDKPLEVQTMSQLEISPLTSALPMWVVSTITLEEIRGLGCTRSQ